MTEQTNNPEILGLPKYLTGDIIDYTSIAPEKPLVLVVKDHGDKLEISKVTVEDGKYRASGIGGGHEKPVDRETILVDHLNREEILDALARFAGPDGSDGFSKYRQAITPGLDELLEG